MHVVNKEKVSLLDGMLISEASTLELEPGYWPEFISILNNQNEGYIFHRARPIHYGDEFCGYEYVDWMGGGIRLSVYND